MKCPKCGKEHKRLLALSRKDNKTMICDNCGMLEALKDYQRKDDPAERTRKKVYATGNRWARENFEATHS